MSPNSNNDSLSSIDETAAAVEEGFSSESSINSKEKSSGTRLSMISKMYDRDGKGYLDDNEKKMREMDTSNRGYLTNDRVYSMLEEQMKMQKQMVTQRWLIIGLCVFAVILALANMGTAFAAANLSKDTTVDQTTHGLMTKDGSDVVGTKPITGTQIQLNGEDKKCVSIGTISNAYKEVANGSPVSVITSTENVDTARTVTEVSSTSEKICFGGSVCFDLTDDSCSKDEDGNARRLSDKDKKERARLLADSFDYVVKGSSSGRELDQRRLPGPACTHKRCVEDCNANGCNNCCVASASSTCPSTMPTFGATCSLPSDMECYFETSTCCDGTISDGDFWACNNNQWQILYPNEGCNIETCP